MASVLRMLGEGRRWAAAVLSGPQQAAAVAGAPQPSSVRSGGGGGVGWGGVGGVGWGGGWVGGGVGLGVCVCVGCVCVCVWGGGGGGGGPKYVPRNEGDAHESGGSRQLQALWLLNFHLHVVGAVGGRPQEEYGQ